MSEDNVRNPKHYQIIDGFESIDIIASCMTEEAWKGFCLGNIIKYVLYLIVIIVINHAFP